MKITRRNIWTFAQNKPTQIVEDLLEQIGPNSTYSENLWKDCIYETLLQRGVFKWLGVRRSLIKLKNTWKEKITYALECQKQAKAEKRWADVHYMRGYRRAMEECRADVRKLCHSERWQCPDHDKAAKQWLEQYELPQGVKIRPNSHPDEDGWMWAGPNGEGDGPFIKPEEAVEDCLKYYEKNNNAPSRRNLDHRSECGVGYDANGSPVPILPRRHSQGKDVINYAE